MRHFQTERGTGVHKLRLGGAKKSFPAAGLGVSPLLPRAWATSCRPMLLGDHPPWPSERLVCKSDTAQRFSRVFNQA